MDPLALTISQAAKLGGPCRSALYEDIKAGRLRAVKRGRSTRILINDFREYLAALPQIKPNIAPPQADVQFGKEKQQRRLTGNRRRAYKGPIK
jgi:excisionase family DNA binding protein